MTIEKHLVCPRMWRITFGLTRLPDICYTVKATLVTLTHMGIGSLPLYGITLRIISFGQH